MKRTTIALFLTLPCAAAATHPATDWAKSELMHWTERICGERAEADFLLPGDTPDFAEDFAALKGTDGYAVRLGDGGKVVFLADCPKGHVNAVFGWLERNTDIVWPRPKDGLAIFSRKPLSAFTENSYRDIPAFRDRFFGCKGGPPETAVWRARNMTSGTVDVRHYFKADGAKTKAGELAEKLGCLGGYRNCWGNAHNMVGWWFPHREHADHPEYYMLFGGKRAEKDCCNLCETNPEMIAAFCKSVEEKSRGIPPWVEEIAVLMEDTGDTCQCENCLRPIVLADGTCVTPDDPAFKSTRFFLFFNQVARHMAKVRPGTVLRQYAYVHLSVPPKCPVEPNVKLSWCPYPRNMKESIVEGPSNANWKERLDGWLAITKNIYYREYYFCGCIIYPRPIADTAAPDLRYIKKAGVETVYADAGVNDDIETRSAPGYNNLQPCCDFFTMCGPEAWATMRLMWNPDRDPVALRHEFLRRTYREAAPSMIRFYDLVRESWYSDPMASGWSDSAWRSAAHYLAKKGYETPCRNALIEAEQTALDNRSSNEVRRVRAVFETWMKAAPDYMTEEKRIPVVACEGTPPFDLDAGVWTKAAEFPPLKQLKRDEAGRWLPDPTNARVKMFSDGHAFWVGAHAKKDPASLVSLTKPGNEPFPQGDEMEFLFSSEKDGYYQFAFDVKLNRYEAKVYDRSWNGEWTPQVKVVADGWISVVRFPFETLGFEPIRNNRIRFFPLVSNYFGGRGKNVNVGWGGGSTASPASWGELTVDIE